MISTEFLYLKTHKKMVHLCSHMFGIKDMTQNVSSFGGGHFGFVIFKG